LDKRLIRLCVNSTDDSGTEAVELTAVDCSNIDHNDMNMLYHDKSEIHDIRTI